MPVVMIQCTYASASNSFEANTSLHRESFSIGWLHRMIHVAACSLHNEALILILLDVQNETQLWPGDYLPSNVPICEPFVVKITEISEQATLGIRKMSVRSQFFPLNLLICDKSQMDHIWVTKWVMVFRWTVDESRNEFHISQTFVIDGSHIGHRWVTNGLQTDHWWFTYESQVGNRLVNMSHGMCYRWVINGESRDMLHMDHTLVTLFCSAFLNFLLQIYLSVTVTTMSHLGYEKWI